MSRIIRRVTVTLPGIGNVDAGLVGIRVVARGFIGPPGAGDAGGGGAYSATSTTSLSIGTGSKTLTTQSGLDYVVGSRLRLVNSADVTEWMEGPVTAYSGTSLTFTSELTNGSGTVATWNLSIAGERGQTGATGATGATGETGATGAAGATGPQGDPGDPGPSSIPTGNTLWVDAVNGNDTTGTSDRQDLPYLTLAGALADAVSGDLIHVRPGAYTVTASLATNGVNWHFEAGATVTASTTSGSGRIGIWDDGGSAMTFKVTGAGSFVHNIDIESDDGSVTEGSNVICNSHASTVMDIEATDITLTRTGDYGAIAINAVAGSLRVNCRDVTLSSSGASPAAIWWNNGECVINGSHCLGSSVGVYSECDSSPTGDLHVSFDTIEGTSDSGVYADGSNGDAAIWIRANIVTGGTNSVYTSSSGNLNKVYVESQKLIGSIYTGGGLLYVRSDKLSATSTNPLVYGLPGSTSYIQVNHWEPTSTGLNFYIFGGTHYIFGGVAVGGASTAGVNITDGNTTFYNVTIDTSANSSTRPITKSGGTLTLTNCTLVAEGTVDSVYAASGQTVNVGGVLTANRPVNANITLAGGPLLRSDTSTIVSPTFSTPVLGTPASGTLTNCSGLPISGIASLGTGVATALGNNTNSSGGPVTGGAITSSGLTMATARLLGRTTASTGAVEELTLGTDVATLIGLAADGTDVDAIGYRGLPQVSFSAATNIIASHNGKTLLHPSSDTNDRTLTIQANGTLALEVGFAFEVINDSANDVTLAITTDTLVQAGSGTTGSITIPQYGTCFVRKIASTRWYATLVDA